MEQTHRPRTGFAELIGYSIPELHINKSGAYVDYYVRHPFTGLLKRKRVKLNHVKGLAAQRVAGRLLVGELTRKLHTGWNPFDPTQAKGAFLTLEQALAQYESVKTKQTRHSSPYSYVSLGSVLLEWARARGMAKRMVQDFSRVHAQEFLQHLTDERGVGNRTWNNYRIFGAMFFTFCHDRGMCSDNPFKSIKALRTAGKSRTYLTEEERVEMVNWISDHEPDFLLPCVLIFGALIRPGEIKRLRVSHVDLKRQVIMLPAELTKSGIERMPAIPNWMMPYLYKAQLHQQPSGNWLVGSRLAPGPNPVARNTLNRHWVRLRKDLGWPSSKQLYSLRDTGIIQLIRDGVDLLHVMQQAGHTEIATTNKYLKHAFPNGPAEIKDRATSLYSMTPIGPVGASGSY